jgi:hypothetical protein
MRNAVGFSTLGAPNEGALPPAAGGTGGASGAIPSPGGPGDPGNESVAGGGTINTLSFAGAGAGAGAGGGPSARAAPDARSSTKGKTTAQRY